MVSSESIRQQNNCPILPPLYIDLCFLFLVLLGKVLSAAWGVSSSASSCSSSWSSESASPLIFLLNMFSSTLDLASESGSTNFAGSDLLLTAAKVAVQAETCENNDQKCKFESWSYQERCHLLQNLELPQRVVPIAPFRAPVCSPKIL